MPRTKRCHKKYTYSKRVRKGGGLMNLIRRRTKDNVKDNVNEKISDKNKLDLIVLALGGMEEIGRLAKANEDKLKQKLKNELDNPLVEKPGKSPPNENIYNPPAQGLPSAQISAQDSVAQRMSTPPPSGGRRTRRRRKY